MAKVSAIGKQGLGDWDVNPSNIEAVGIIELLLNNCIWYERIITRYNIIYCTLLALSEL